MPTAADAELDPKTIAPYWLGEGPRGVLLLHGFAGTPPEMRPLGEALAKRGFLVYAPLLAGHGTTPEDMETTGHRDWISSAETGLEALRERCSAVGLAGQSMGAALALHLAAQHAQPRALVCQSAFTWIRDWRLALLPLAQHLVRWQVPSDRVDLYNAQAIADLHNYRRRPTRAIAELMKLCRLVRGELPAVFRPLLLLQGGRDSVIDPANSGEILARVTSDVRALRVFPRSGHGLSVDVDREAVAEVGADWLERHVLAEGDGSPR
ncbi:MAG: alpha/beta hydrolase [Candidatus Dormibacteria bacterium]